MTQGLLNILKDNSILNDFDQLGEMSLQQQDKT